MTSDAVLERAVWYARQGRRAEAVECMLQCIRDEPDVARHYFNAGNMAGDNDPRKIEYLEKAVSLDDSLLIAKKGLVLAYISDNQCDKAHGICAAREHEHLFFRTVKLYMDWYLGKEPEDGVLEKHELLMKESEGDQELMTLLNRSLALFCTWNGDVKRAITIYQQLLSQPNGERKEILYELGNALLLSRDFPRGFRVHSESMEMDCLDGSYAVRLPTDRPLWDGEPIDALLVTHLYGIGDLLLFLRCLYGVADRVRGRIFLSIDTSLISVMKESKIREDLPNVFFVQKRFEHILWPSVDAYIEVGSLAKFVPDMTFRPYLTPPARVPQRRGRLRAVIHTQGNKENKALEFRRRLPTEEALHLVNCTRDRVEWINVAKNLPPEDVEKLRSGGVACLGDGLDNDGNAFEHTIPVLWDADLVVTVDTSIAHLAATLNIPTWVLCSTQVDWRWGLSGAASEFYPSARIFRQSRFMEWRPVMEAVARALGDFVPPSREPRQPRKAAPKDGIVCVIGAKEDPWQEAMTRMQAPEFVPTWAPWDQPHRLTLLLIEFRDHPWLRPVLHNLAHVYGRGGDVSLVVLHGSGNEAAVLDVVKDWTHVKCLCFPRSNIDLSEYNCLLKSSDLWEVFQGKCEFLLVCQTDALLRRRIEEDFFEYDYVGAAWGWLPGGTKRPVGNGGLSLRRVSEMIRVCSERHGESLDPEEPEDVFFSKYVRSIPPVGIAKRFSVETQFCSDPCGMHKPYPYLPHEWVRLLLRDVPGLPGFEASAADFAKAARLAPAGSDAELDLLTKAPRDRDTLFRVALGLHARAMWGETVDLISEREASSDPRTLALYAEALWRTGSFGKGLALLKRSGASVMSAAYANHAMGKLSEAQKLFRRALDGDPCNHDLMLAYGSVLLERGKLKQGFHHYCEYQKKHPIRNCAKYWEGDPVETLVIVGDKGIGDVLMFARFVPQACARASRVFLTVRSELHWMFEGLGCEVVGEDFVAPSSSSGCHLMYLPKALGVTEIPKPFFLRVPEGPPGGKPRLVLQLAGNANNPHLEYRRRVPLGDMTEVVAATRDRFEWVSVAKDLEPEAKRWLRENGVADLGDCVDLSDKAFEDTVQILQESACLVSCDTAIVHLAQGMGKRTILLLSDFPEWRWGLRSSQQCAWYPPETLTIVRKKGDDWSSVARTVIQKINSLHMPCQEEEQPERGKR
jgi:tetratricopeptide (TPR) repeat protein